MDSFELNKIMGAVLGTCLALLSINIAAGALFSPKAPEKPGYDIVVPDTPAPGGPVAPAEPAQPVEQLLAKADPGRGEASFRKCGTCHTSGKGEANKVGPNLYGVVGRAKASVPGFNYSAAMKSQSGEWNFAELNTYLQNPKAMVPGTTMSFAGIARATERADLLVFLNSKSDSPAPLPQAAQAPAEPAQAPAAAAPPAAGAPARAPAAPQQ